MAIIGFLASIIIGLYFLASCCVLIHGSAFFGGSSLMGWIMIAIGGMVIYASCKYGPFAISMVSQS